MRLIGYIRVSRVAGREGDTFISPAVQRETIERHAKGGGHELVAWEQDLDQPGSREDRPAFQRALAAVEAGEADGIAVAKLDRFARSVAGAARSLERLEAAGGVLVAVDLGLDTSKPAGRLMRNVLTALAEFELDRIRESWASARERAIGRGVHICRVPPAGYRRGDDGRLELDPEAAPIIREVFRRRAEGDSWDTLAAYLDEALPRPDGGRWTRQTVSSLVARRTYLGEARQGDVANADAHEPLVTRAEWEAAQAAPMTPTSREGGALLAGLIRCASCGYAMTRMTDGKRGYSNYRCRTRHGAGVCPEPARLSVKRADEHVESAFLAFLERDTPTFEAAGALDEAAAVAAVESAEAELAAYRDANLISIIGREAFIAGLTERQTALDEARRDLDAARRAGVRIPVEAHTLRADWPNLTTDERRELLTAAIDAVAVTRAQLPGQGSSVAERVRIYWRGEAPADLPGRGGTAALRALAVA